MYSLESHTLARANGLLIFFLVFITSIHLLSSSLLHFYESAILYNMPVITRSQSKTSSLNLIEQKVSPLQSTNTSVDRDLQSHSSLTNCSILTAALHDNNYDACGDPPNDELLSLASNKTSPLLVSLDFQNSSRAKTDFKISKSSIGSHSVHCDSFENYICPASPTRVHNY